MREITLRGAIFDLQSLNHLVRLNAVFAEISLSLEGGDLSKESAKNAYKKSVIAKNDFHILTPIF